MASRFCTTAVFLAATVAGCSQNVSPPATAPVSGKVAFKGQPGAGIRVTLHPQFDIGRIKWTVTGETGADGAFKVGTGVPGNGAPPGDYVVTFEKPRTASDPQHNGVEMEVDDFQGKYSDPAQSAWKVTVTKGDNVLPPFQLD